MNILGAIRHQLPINGPLALMQPISAMDIVMNDLEILSIRLCRTTKPLADLTYYRIADCVLTIDQPMVQLEPFITPKYVGSVNGPKILDSWTSARGVLTYNGVG